MAETIQYEAEGWGVGALWFEDDTLLWHELPSGTATGTGARPSNKLAERLRSYFSGGRESFGDVELDLDGFTPFQRTVVETLRSVSWGEVVTYGELAALAGYPNAQRAAGSVCAHNRFPLVIPCHRVVAANGIGRYGLSGVEYKRRLLELEHVFL